jgi:putative Mg2+ transporter-C (MgtC) family protein
MPPLFVRLLLDSWFELLPTPWAQIALVLVAAVSGGIIGGERERREKAAGLRTLMLVCLGSAIFTLAGYSFTSRTGDSGRVAAQIVTGIGFLGAGVILHGRGTISGTTTAATIWVTAAIGMTAATGYAAAALGASILVRAVLFGARKIEVYRLAGLAAVAVAIEFEPAGGKTRVRIERVLADYQAGSIVPQWSEVDSQRLRVALQLRLPQRHLRELLAELADIPGILTIEQGARGSLPTGIFNL